MYLEGREGEGIKVKRHLGDLAPRRSLDPPVIVRQGSLYSDRDKKLK